MLATFDPLLFARIMAGSFVLGYLVCLILKEIFGVHIGRRRD